MVVKQYYPILLLIATCTTITKTMQKGVLPERISDPIFNKNHVIQGNALYWEKCIVSDVIDHVSRLEGKLYSLTGYINIFEKNEKKIGKTQKIIMQPNQRKINAISEKQLIVKELIRLKKQYQQELSHYDLLNTMGKNFNSIKTICTPPSSPETMPKTFSTTFPHERKNSFIFFKPKKRKSAPSVLVATSMLRLLPTVPVVFKILNTLFKHKNRTTTYPKALEPRP